MPRPRLAAPLQQRRPLSTLRLSQSTRTHLTNASFVAAAAFAVLTVTLGMQHLPCPARAPEDGRHKTLGMEGERWTPDEKGKGKSKRRWLDDPVAPGVPKRAFVAGQATDVRRMSIKSDQVVQEPERRNASRTPGVAVDGGDGREGWIGWARKVTIGS